MTRWLEPIFNHCSLSHLHAVEGSIAMSDIPEHSEDQAFSTPHSFWKRQQLVALEDWLPEASSGTPQSQVDL